MKTTLTILLLLIYNVLASQIQYPPFSIRNSNSIEIKQVEIVKNKTAITILSNKQVLNIPKNIFIEYGNSQILHLLYADSVVTGERKVFEYNREFILYFNSLPSNINMIDLHFGNIIIWGIEFKSAKLSNTTNIPEDFVTTPKGTMPMPEYAWGEGTLKGYIHGAKNDTNFTLNVTPFNILSGECTIYSTTINNGNFEIKVPLTTTSEQVLFSIEKDYTLYSQNVMLSQGEETSVFIDLPEIFRVTSQYRVDREPYNNPVHFKGKHAELNNHSAKIQIAKTHMNNKLYTVDSDADTAILKKQIHDIITETEKEFLSANKNIPDYIKKIAHYQFLLEGSQNLFDNSNADKHYYKFLNDYNLDKPFLTSLWEYRNFIDYTRRLKAKELKSMQPNIIKYMMANNMVKPGDYEQANALANYTYETPEEKNAFNTFTENIYIQGFGVIIYADYLSKIIPKGQFTDLLLVNSFGYRMSIYIPLQEYEVNKLNTLTNPKLKEMTLEMNNNIITAPKKGILAQKTLDELIADNKGKVILIDFWGVWCSPCRSTFRVMEPLKKDLDNVVYIYICDDKLEKYWKLIYPNISGYHYRITPNEQVVLQEKYKIGYDRPNYVIIDKQGNINHAGFIYVNGIISKIKSIN